MLNAQKRKCNINPLGPKILNSISRLDCPHESQSEAESMSSPRLLTANKHVIESWAHLGTGTGTDTVPMHIVVLASRDPHTGP